MRGVQVAVLAASGLLLGSWASAQGLGDVAAQEKQKRQAGGAEEAKVYTESDLGPSVAPVAVTETQGVAEAGEPLVDDDTATGESAEAPSEDDQRAQAEEAWRKKLEQARQEEQIYKDVVDKLQLELNDMSGGVYNPGRANRIAFLEENKQLLADTRQRITDLESEGRAKRYR